MRESKEARLLRALKPLAAELAAIVEEGQIPATTPAYVDQTNSPLSRRHHLALARRPGSRASRVGKRVYLAFEVIERFLEEHRDAGPLPADGDDDVLSCFGLAPEEDK